MVFHACWRSARCGLGSAAPERRSGARPGQRPGQRIAAALGLAIALASLAALTVAPAFAQGRLQKNKALAESVGESSLVQLLVTVDKAKTVGCDQEFVEVLVANPAIADVIALSNKQVYVLGKKAGITSISLVGTNKKIIGLVNVEVAHDVDGLTQRLRRFVPNSEIVVTSVNGKVLLTGTVPDAPSVSRAMAIAEQVAPGGCHQRLDGARLAAGAAGGEVHRGDPEFRARCRRRVGDRRQERQGKRGGHHRASAGLLTNNTPFGVAVARVLDNGTTADVLIQALEKRGVARRLAEPNLVALSGDTASFLAGGEFPIPVQADNNRITLEYKKFGVGLAFTPTVLGEGLINLKIEPEVSEIDPTNSVRVNSCRGAGPDGSPHADHA